ncbi:glycosyl hydrolase [Microdochium bolleyi]|uniref:Glycosyl hydrolase n=1 Tax=Microdochium bolleyi TaxID=196109 RepID=A0A136ILV8_9PEZI|nr:glycosyl hydrolase [Microdochium bolleyi]
MIPPRPLLWSRRKKWLLGGLAGLCIVGLILGLSIGLTRPGSTQSDNTDPDSGTGNNNTGDDGYTGDGYTGALQYPNPESITGIIPHNRNYITLDPALIRRRSDRRLFLLTTAPGKRGATWTADSLRGPWTLQGDTLAEQGGAPDVHVLNATHYLMLHNQHFPYDTIGVTHPEATVPWHDASIVVHTSRTLEPGSWVRQGRLEITWAARYNILDAALITVEDSSPTATEGGQRHLLTFGSYQEGLFQIPLADPPLALAPNAMQQITHLERNASAVSPRGQTEAGFMYGPRKGWYYLFFSSGRCCPRPDPDAPKGRGRGGAPGQNMLWMRDDNAYRVVVCRSRRPRGGFVDRLGRDCLTEDGGSVVLASHDAVFAPGGQGVFEDEVEGLVLYYHYIYYDKTLGAADSSRTGFFFGWNKLRFDQRGWPYVDGA